MQEQSRILPIGIQSFESIRKDGYLYVDKTAYIYEMVHFGKPYFLSRPRRFGKSLFLSTLRAYWEGKKELFQGLEIERLEADNPEAWQSYPVFYFDFNRDDYRQKGALAGVLEAHLKEWEKLYGCEDPVASHAVRFQNLLLRASRQSGKRCVVLIDEYDKPLLEVMNDPIREAESRSLFKGFFSSLKSFEEQIQFILITGVTKFSKVSIFSDLNQLNDISQSARFAGICGITEAEMKSVFLPEITELAVCQEVSPDTCLKLLKDTYDGYHFHQDSEGLFNPFSLLKALYEKEIAYYWFATGTPTFLAEKIRDDRFDVRRFTNQSIFAGESMLSDYRAENPDPVPLLYQTGYLTITAYDRRRKRYTLGFPNEEVKYGFLESLMPVYTTGHRDAACARAKLKQSGF